MNLTRIRYFIEAARCGSFSEAARRLYTAQPNLSKQIALLEQELGFSLFVRAHRSVILTPAGEKLYEAWKELPDRMDHDIASAAELARSGVHRIVIGVLEGQDVNNVLRDRLMKISEVYPSIEFSLERNSYRNLRSGLRSGHYDLIITLSFDVDDAEDLLVRTMYEKVPAVALQRTNPLAAKENLTLSDLRNENFIVISREESPGGYERLMQSCSDCGFTPKIVREPLSLESLLLCVEMGLGIALLDQNTRLELSPYIVTIPQDAEPMGVVAVILKDETRIMHRDILRMLTENK